MNFQVFLSENFDFINHGEVSPYFYVHMPQIECPTVSYLKKSEKLYDFLPIRQRLIKNNGSSTLYTALPHSFMQVTYCIIINNTMLLNSITVI